MTVTPPPRELAAELGNDGEFRRQTSAFRRWISAEPGAELPLQAGRYHLYVARACPWAHRTIIARQLMGLQEVIPMSFLDPVRDERGWAFTGGPYRDPVNGFEFLAQGYRASDPSYQARVTVPVLWDTESGVIVNNESADILRMLGTVFSELAAHPVELCPQSLRGEIDELNHFIYAQVNDAVYKTGFARRQDVYERECRSLFAALDRLDQRLADRRYLFGSEPVETDIRLFTTLVRFDAVYHIHFKCSQRKLIEYANLWPYARDLYQRPGFGETVNFEEIRRHYYLTHPSINPSRLIALAPLASFEEPHGRDRV